MEIEHETSEDPETIEAVHPVPVTILKSPSMAIAQMPTLEPQKASRGPIPSPAGLNSHKIVRFSPNNVIEEAQPVKIHFAVLASPLIATLLAVLVATALFSASTKVVVSTNSYHSEVIIQVANLIEILQQKF